jgi:phosphoesterase RecJ-like protein
MTYQQTAVKILETISNSNYILLISHEKPDGDTLGSSLALANFLDTLAKKYTHFCSDQPADYFKYLLKIENIISDQSQLNLAEYDLVITVDCGDIKRTGIQADLLKLKNQIQLINIDHHQSNNYFGNLNLVITNASSTSEIIYNFFQLNHLEIDKYIATSLLTGILTDTMNFTNAATNQASLKIAADLLKKGAKIKQIIKYLTANKNLSALKLWGTVLSRLEFSPRYNYAYTVITQEDLLAHQISANEASDGLANFLSALQDIDFILVLTQEIEQVIKGSLRTTKDEVDVGQIAKALGGGGHAKAAGFKINGQLIKAESGWQIV